MVAFWLWMLVTDVIDFFDGVFFFRVVPGKTPLSLGPACAAMASMPTRIVQRGIYLSFTLQSFSNFQ